MNTFVTLEDLKAFIGISGTSKDSKLNMLNRLATSVVNSILNTSNCLFHEVADERHYPSSVLDLKDLKVVEVCKIMDGDAEYTQDEEYDILSSRVKLSKPLDSAPREYFPGDTATRSVKVTYAAGWFESYWGKIVINDVSAMDFATNIQINKLNEESRVDITRGVDWFSQTTAEAEAKAIAAAINVKGSGIVRAVAACETVYIIEVLLPTTSGREMTVNQDTGLTFDSHLLNEPNFPEDIKLALMLYVSSLLESSKNPRVKNYTIGSKTVTFASDAEFQQFNNLLASYKRAKIKAI